METEKSCGCIVIKNHKVLIVSAKDDQGDIFWSFPKGHQEKGESDTETAIRETREETGINPIITDRNPIVVKHLVHNNTAIKLIYFFIATTKTDRIIIQEDEIETAEWVTFQEASERLRSYYHQAWQEAQARLRLSTTKEKEEKQRIARELIGSAKGEYMSLDNIRTERLGLKKISKTPDLQSTPQQSF